MYRIKFVIDPAHPPEKATCQRAQQDDDQNDWVVTVASREDKIKLVGDGSLIELIKEIEKAGG